MANYTATRHAGQIAPLECYYYFDNAQIWLKKPLGPGQLRRIEGHCHGGRPNGLHWVNKPCPFQPGYCQRLQLHQPTQQALELLAAMTAAADEPLINYVEVACDLIFEDQNEADKTVEYFLEHLVQPWHRKSMKIRCFYKWEEIDGIDFYRDWPIGFSTRNTRKGKRGRMGHWFVGYSSLPCRLTGETPCFHVEGRHSSVRSLQRIGINDLSDLIDFDFDAYFASNMTLYELDCERLGRFHRNRLSGSKSRHSSVKKMGKSGFTYNRDHRLGATLYNSLSLHRDDPYHDQRSLQKFVDEYPKSRRFLTPVSLYSYTQ